MDGTLIEAGSSKKSFKPKDPPVGDASTEGGCNEPADFEGEERTKSAVGG